MDSCGGMLSLAKESERLAFDESLQVGVALGCKSTSQLEMESDAKQKKIDQFFVLAEKVMPKMVLYKLDNLNFLLEYTRFLTRANWAMVHGE